MIGCRKSNSHEFWQFSFETAGRIGHEGTNNIVLQQFEDDCYESMHVGYIYNSIYRYSSQ